MAATKKASPKKAPSSTRKATKKAPAQPPAPALLEQHGIAAAWGVYLLYYTALATVQDGASVGSTPAQVAAANEARPILGRYEERVIADIVARALRWRSISDKQVAFVKSLLERLEKRPELDAQRAKEAAEADPVPTGTQDIEGEVLGVRVVDRVWGITKVLVRGPGGWKVWGRLPKGTVPERGSTIRFRATIKAAPDDPKFGFFNRAVMLS